MEYCSLLPSADEDMPTVFSSGGGECHLLNMRTFVGWSGVPSIFYFVVVVALVNNVRIFNSIVRCRMSSTL